MPPDAWPARAPAGAAVPASWRSPLAALAVAWIGLIAVFWRDWRDMAAQWWDISTYNHILLVPAVVAWLVAARWRELLRLAPLPWWPGLIAFALAMLLWVLGEFAGLSLARHLAAVAMLQAAVLTCLGPRVAVGLAFPLAYMLFLTPAGEELVPLLQLATARLTMVLLGLSGIPALLEGIFITTPAGYFRVAEACSGIKFLIAMAAFATLAANLCFTRWTRRVAFVVMALGLAVLANGVRAWGTIAIAQWRGIAFAGGFDHIFYGWVFFAIVLAAVLALGWRWFDRSAQDPAIDAKAIEGSAVLGRLGALRTSPGRALAGLAAICAIGLGWAAAAASLVAPLPSQIDLPAVAGWQRTGAVSGSIWHPRHGGADHRLAGRYANAQGDAVDVSFALYAYQSEGREAGGFGQGATPAGGDWSWAAPTPPIAGGAGERIGTDRGELRTAVTWYRSGEFMTGSVARLKLANIADRLLLRRRATAVLIVSAVDRPQYPGDAAVERFVAATGNPAAWMDRIAAGR